MPTLLSPGVVAVEKDFSNIIPTVSTGIGAIAGRFSRGPINTPVLISNEDELVRVFGKPYESGAGGENNTNEWFTASQFLQYTNKLWVVRAANATVVNAVSGTAASAGTALAIFNSTEYESADLTNAGYFVSRTPGVFGNSLAVIMLDSNNYTNFVTWATTTGNLGLFPNKIPMSDYVSYAPGTTQYAANKGKASCNDELHILVVDLKGEITGTPYTIIEQFEGLSKAADAVNYKGDALYYKAAINNNSRYIWFANAPSGTDLDSITGTWGSEVYEISTTFSPLSNENTLTGPVGSSATGFMFRGFSGGLAGTATTEAEIKTAYDKLKNTDLYDVNLILTGAFNLGTPGAIAAYVISNIATGATGRKDSVVFVSPYAAQGKPLFDTVDNTTPEAVVSFKSAMNVAETDSSYAVMDTGFKYIYDRYNNKYRWVPLNGDVAGICARTDDLADPWFSPGGFNRGGVKNVVKLAFNPTQAQRDYLYPKGINPVVSFPGQGVVLFGDRTMTLKPSAFDRINVRRLFLILEKAISIAAKYMLFEFNDSFTRAQFRNMVEPYLRSIQGRRGITDFKVTCDESNNTGQIIDSNQFVADIYIKPARSINFITLSFVATRTDVSFSSVVGG